MTIELLQQELITVERNNTDDIYNDNGLAQAAASMRHRLSQDLLKGVVRYVQSACWTQTQLDHNIQG